MKKLLFISTCLVLLFAVQANKPLESEFKGTTKREFFNKGSELKIYWEKDSTGISTLYVDEKLKTVIRLQGKHSMEFPVVFKAMCDGSGKEFLMVCEDADLIVQSDGKIVVTENRGYMRFDNIDNVKRQYPEIIWEHDTSK